MNVDFTLSKIIQADKTEMKKLAYNNGGNQNLTEEYIEHWYFNNPSNSYSLWKVLVNGAIEGFATTNNFKFYIDGKECLVAIPQNVLTSTNFRGKGLFEKLYFRTEIENIKENKVDCFLNLWANNSMSTPIFLNKLGYSEGMCPSLLLTPFNLYDLFSKSKYERLSNLDSIKFSSIYRFNNAMEKTKAHIRWRYSKYSQENLHVISVKEDQKVIGYAFLKVEKREGLKILILMDIICERAENVPLIIDACFIYTSKNFFWGLLMFDIPFKLRKRIFQISIKERFKFLVRGNTQEETDRLSRTKFTLFFGDLDFV